MLINSQKPMSVKDILSRLENTNKSTVYRFFDILIQYNLIRQLRIDTDAVYYEIADDHHHHIVCKSCDKVHKIVSEFLEKQIDDLQDELNKKYEFKDIEHSLEFFGLCASCN